MVLCCAVQGCPVVGGIRTAHFDPLGHFFTRGSSIFVPLLICFCEAGGGREGGREVLLSVCAHSLCTG